MGRPHFRPGGAVSRRAAPQERDTFRHITIPDHDPAAMNRSHGTPDGETLLGSYLYELVCPLVQGQIVSDKCKRQSTE